VFTPRGRSEGRCYLCLIRMEQVPTDRARAPAEGSDPAARGRHSARRAEQAGAEAQARDAASAGAQAGAPEEAGEPARDVAAAVAAARGDGDKETP